MRSSSNSSTGHARPGRFGLARRLALLLTVPGALNVLGPLGMRSDHLMRVALRVMANLVTDEENDAVARIWRGAGRAVARFEKTPPFAPPGAPRE